MKPISNQQRKPIVVQECLRYVNTELSHLQKGENYRIKQRQTVAHNAGFSSSCELILTESDFKKQPKQI